jgi:YD repeat-containing protein
MATEGLRKYSTTLFTGVLSGQVPHWSGLLPNHVNLHNHQLIITASQTIADGEGKYAVYIIPDTDGVNQAVDTGLVLDLSNKDSAIVNFTGVIRGLYLQATDIILEPSIRISAVLSSYSRYKKSSSEDNLQTRLDYVTTELPVLSTGTPYSAAADNHVNMIYHQLSLMADADIDDVYNVRIIPESDTPLETSVDIGVQIDFNSTRSAMAYFGGVLIGVVLEKESGTSTSDQVRIVLSSQVERPDEIVYTYIGNDPGLSDHETDYNNPHQVTYEQLGGNKPIIGFPIVRDVLPEGESWSIPAAHQLLVWESYLVLGSLTVEPDGELIVLHDRPETRAVDPDFTYNLSGNLTQIDYAAGEQKLFTYNGSGQLSQVDSLRDGTTLRKSFVYTGGGDLDYITEEWL